MDHTSRKHHLRKNLSFNNGQINDDDEVLARLKSWLLAQNCFSVRELNPCHFPTTGRGLETLRDIKPNQALIKLPYNVLITTSALYQCDFNVIFLQDETYSTQCALSVFLLYQAHLADKSRWHNYILSLPTIFTNPDFCTRREKRALPEFILEYMHHSIKLKTDFYSLCKGIKYLSSLKKDYCPHCNVPLHKLITFDRFKWAYYVVNTRAIYIDSVTYQDVPINIKPPNNLALAPFLDLFNHNVNARVCVSTIMDDDNNQFYQITTLNSFTKGSQVFINYGCHNNLKLYVEYGFIIPDNPLDAVYFDMCDVQACIDIPKFKLDFILLHNLQKNMGFVTQGLNYNAILTLFILSTNLPRSHWNTKIYGDSFSSNDLKAVNNLAVKLVIVKRDQLNQYLKSMKDFKHCTDNFLIATDLIEEYLKILVMSLTHLTGLNQRV